MSEKLTNTANQTEYISVESLSFDPGNPENVESVRLRSMIAHCPIPILRTDIEGSVLSFNAAALKLFKKDPTDLPVGDLIPGMSKDVLGHITSENQYEIEASIEGGNYQFIVRSDNGSDAFLVYGFDINNRTEVENTLLKVNDKLVKWSSKLYCLHEFSRLTVGKNLLPDDIFREFVNRLPIIWPFSGIVCGAIEYGGIKFITDNFNPTEWKYSSDIIVDSDKVGSIHVYHAHEIPKSNDNLRPNEERDFLNDLTTDITKYLKYRQSQNSSTNSDTGFHTLLDKVTEGVLVIQDGAIQFTNAKITELTCYTRSDLLSRPYKDFIKLEDYNLAADLIIRVIADDNPPDSQEFSLISKTGEPKRINAECEQIIWDNKPACMIHCCDETGLKPDEQEREELIKLYEDTNANLQKALDNLEGVENRLSSTVTEYTAMINTVPDAMYFKNSDQKYVVVNKGFCSLMNLEQTEIIGKTDRDIFKEKENRQFLTPDDKVFNDGKIIINREIHFSPDKNENQIWLSLTKVPLHGSDGKVIGFVGVIKDVTEQHRSHDQLIQSDKLAAIGTLAAGVAHEINNPTGYIKSNLNTMSKYLDKLQAYIKTKLPEEEDEVKVDELNDILTDFGDAIKESIDGTVKVRDIVADLKSFARVDRAKKEHVDINEGIKSTLNVVWNELKYKAKIEKDLGDIPELFCMPNQLNQVFMNLLVNAAHSIEGDKGLIKIKTWADASNIYVSVKDNGYGIPENVQNKIFEPFFTTKEVGKGTGLGLSLAIDIIEKHNGNIRVDSKIGIETEFVITLPLEGIDES